MPNYLNVCLPPTASVLDALKAINNEALRVALVVSDCNTLLGVVTDGDIRRGLLNNLSLNDTIAKVMNVDPVTVQKGINKADLIQLMESKGILSIPILDGKTVVGLETLQNALSKPKLENPIFIMAGGFGTRLKPLTDSCPKPMLNVGGRPILETVLNNFIKLGFYKFYISTHFMPEVIMNHFGDGYHFGCEITYLHEDRPLGTGGALGLLPKDLSKEHPIIVMNGDILTKVDFLRLLDFHHENGADSTICVREYEYQVPYGVIEGVEHKIISMVEKPTHRFFVNAGVYVVSPEIAINLEKNKKVDMPNLLEDRIGFGDNVLMFPIHEYWLDIGQMDDFSKAQNDILSLGIM